MKKGGYVIIDLKDFNYDYSHGNKIDGIYNFIKNNIEIYRKQFILSGLVYDSVKYPDIPITIYKKGTSYLSNIDVKFAYTSSVDNDKLDINIIQFKVTYADNVSVVPVVSDVIYTKDGADSAITTATDAVKDEIPLNIFKHTTGDTMTDIQILDHMVFVKPYAPIPAEVGSRTLTGFYTQAEVTKIAEYFNTENDISISCIGVTTLSVTIDIDTGNVTISNSTQTNATNGIYSGTIVI